METALIVLKNTQQQILAEIEMEEATGVYICKHPLLVGWQQVDKKLTRILMTLVAFPKMIEPLLIDISSNGIVLPASDMIALYHENQLKPEVLADYARRKQEVYGAIAVVPAMPGPLSGRA